MTSRAEYLRVLDQMGEPTTATSGTGAQLPDLDPLIVPWPAELLKHAFYGLAGDVVRAIAPESEADPAALLFQFLAAAGSMLGGAPVFYVGKTPHRLNLFTLLIGDTSAGRKGTSLSWILYLLECADAPWRRQCVQHGGLASGEGIIYRLRDAEQTGDGKDPGVTEKRLLVIDEEFGGGALVVAAREGNSLSSVLRQAWDSGNLSSMPKREPMRATGALLSIIGHATRAELLLRLKDSDRRNGFANRFLFCCSRRARELPHGGSVSESVLQELAARIAAVRAFAQPFGQSGPLVLERDGETSMAWESVYHTLSAPRPGILGTITTRGVAQVLRLSMLYAVLDRSRVIRLEHQAAALACWHYAEASAAYVFGASQEDPTQERLLALLGSTTTGRLTFRDVYEAWNGHITAPELRQAVAELNDAGRITVAREATRGRPALVISLRPPLCSQDGGGFALREDGANRLNSLCSLNSQPGALVDDPEERAAIQEAR